MNGTIFAVVGAAFVIIVTAAVLNGFGFEVPESRVDQLIALLIGGVTGGAIATPVAYRAGKTAGTSG